MLRYDDNVMSEDLISQGVLARDSKNPRAGRVLRGAGVMKNEGVRGSEELLQPDVGDAFFVVGIAERGVAEFFVKGSHARLTVDDRTGAA